MNKVLGKSLLLLSVFIPMSFASADSTVVVTPADIAANVSEVLSTPTKWLFYNDETDVIDNTLGSFVAGPAIAPAGTDSVQISVTGTQRRNLATYQFAGTPLSSITTLKYSTYNPSAGNGGSANRAAYINFNVDFDGSDTWQRRMSFVPSQNGTVVQDTWQEWDAINGGNAMWGYSGATWPGTATPGTTLRSWNDILTSYPNVRIRVTDSFFGLRVGEPYANGYTENIDKVVFGTAAGITTFDFEIDAPVIDDNTCDPAWHDNRNHDKGKGRGKHCKKEHKHHKEHSDRRDNDHHNRNHDKDNKGNYKGKKEGHNK